MMKNFLKLLSAGLFVTTINVFMPAWAACNPDSTETGASTATILKGTGDFSCESIIGANQTVMQEIPIDVMIVTDESDGSLSYMWNVTEGSPVKQADKIYVSAGGEGGACVYDFDPGIEAGKFLEPASLKNSASIVACADNTDDVTPPEPRQLISTAGEDCTVEANDLQNVVNMNPKFTTVIGIGPDSEGRPIGAVCSGDSGVASQTQCIGTCEPPISGFYEMATCNAMGQEQCLTERVCATSEEVPTASGEPYCWEKSHQVDFTDSTFIAPLVKGEGNATFQFIEGSTCVLVTMKWAGFTYSYWAPSDCPN